MLQQSNYEIIKKGDTAPGFTLKATTGEYTLKKGKPILIVFMCNHCPYVLPKIPELKRIAREHDIEVIGINANDPTKYPEDSFENMKKLGVNFPYLLDETQEIAKLYGAECTPDPFFFDSELRLVYHGRIDDAHRDEHVTEHELYNVIDEFLRTGQVTRNEEPSMGCSIKWK